MKIRKNLSRLLILLGISLVLTALVLEAYHYPWRTLFSGSQREASVPDPSPIVLEDKDRFSVEIQSEPETSPEVSSEDPPNPHLLPGDEQSELPPLSVYEQLGILKIPKLGVSQYVLEGTQRQLHYGVGHVEWSKGIGQKGNSVIAGHRSTVFRYLNKLVSGDSVILKAGDNVYTYSVYDSFTVLPDETWVLGDVPEETYTLTLITCTPYVSFTHRLIVRARLTDINGSPTTISYKH